MAVVSVNPVNDSNGTRRSNRGSSNGGTRSGGQIYNAPPVGRYTPQSCWRRQPAGYASLAIEIQASNLLANRRRKYDEEYASNKTFCTSKFAGRNARNSAGSPLRQMRNQRQQACPAVKRALEGDCGRQDGTGGVLGCAEEVRQAGRLLEVMLPPLATCAGR